MDRKTKVAAVILLVSAVIHLAYPVLYHNPEATTPVAIFGVIYLIISLGLLLSTKKLFLYAAAAFTTIGMIAATIVYLGNESPFDLDIVLILIDIVIVPVFWWGIFKNR
jgi:uncharacterized membrane protein